MSGMDRLTCGCGKAAPKLEELSAGGWRVSCYGCHIGTFTFPDGQQAISAWNRRASQAAPAPSDALREALERLEAKASAVSSAHARKGNIGFAVAEMGPTIMSARAALSTPAENAHDHHG